MGGVAAKYSYLGSPTTVTNEQSILFIPDGRSGLVPNVEYVSTLASGGCQLRVTGLPRERCIVQVSSDLVSWASLATNLIPDDGVLPVEDASAAGPGQRFYRAVIQP